ncbi:MAG: pyridine nucleotide-disulfide oxidoreductase, partial [Methylococcus sp.]
MTDASLTQLGIAGFSYADLYDSERLQALSECFDASLANECPELHAEFVAYRASQGEGMAPEQISDLLVRTAPKLGNFVARLFGVEAEHEAQAARIRADFDTIFAYKNEIVAKSASRFKGEDPATWDITELSKRFESLVSAAIDEESLRSDREAAVAALAVSLKSAVDGGSTAAVALIRGRLMANEPADAWFGEILKGDDTSLALALHDLIGRWTFAATRLDALKSEVSDWVSFKTPAKTDFAHLVHHELRQEGDYGVWTGPAEHHRRRDGFGLTDPRFPERRVLYEVDHCIYCHDRDTDSCSKGMRNKKDGTYKVNPLGVTITGCPLEEKISEMHFVKRQGDNLGALALITIDNPLCPGTGHRICNDCMKGCIYQKTQPVNIPQIETNVLTDVLFMPWGFEIYSLLTRWNPLNIKRPAAL